jgi:carboxypeptidase family protein/TonB-dependent receptor-like protein
MGQSKIFTLVLIIFIPMLGFGQTGSGSITGTVKDATDAPIPSVDIKISNLDTGVQFDTLSNEVGLYRVTALGPGNYRIEAELPGFNHLSQGPVVLQVGQTLGVDLVLQVGEVSESVEVLATVGLVESQTSSLGQVVDHTYIENLPLPNHSANALISLSPGVVMISPGSGAENYPIFSVAGGRARNQNFTLDGGSINNVVGLARPSQVASLPLDALEEFRVISNNYAAEYGHSTGGVLALSTRSGTNDFHGSLFEYLRNDALDARNFFSKDKPPLRMNQFGGSVGGPIRKNKTHFFAAWEETRQVTSDAMLSTVPTLAQRQGDFSGGATIYDPFNVIDGVKQPFPGNKIPFERIDPVARAASAYWPLPNRPTDSNGANNYLGNTHLNLNRHIAVGKVDHVLNQMDSLSIRYFINDAQTTDAGSYGIAVADPLATRTDVRIQSVLGTYTHAFSSSVLNTFQVSLMRRKFVQTRGGAGDDYASKIGLRGVSAAAFPTINVAGYALLGSQAVANSSIARMQTPIRDWQVQDSISKVVGKHAFKAGIEYRVGLNNESNDLSSSGNLVFNRLITDLPSDANTGNAYASFLLGAANSASITATDVIPSRASYWAAYGQDDFRITDRLTLNAGLRWEVETPRYVDGDKQNGFDPVAINPISGTPGVVTFSGRNGQPRTAFDANYKNFGPRLGFAYNAPFSKDFVIRGGCGILYGPNVSNSINTSASLGFSDNVSYVTSQAETAYVFLLSDGFPAYTRPSIDTPGFGAVKVGERPTTAVQYYERHRPSPVSYQYNLDIQKMLFGNLLVEAGYMGNVSHHLTSNDATVNQLLPSQFGAGNTQVLRPFTQFSNVTILNPPVGNSTYHGLFLKSERRFSNGFSFLAHYTFSKLLDDAASGDEFGDPGSYMDQYNRRLDKARSGTDVPHHFLLTGVYELPKFQKSKALGLLAGGWQLSTEVNLQSGAVFTVYDSANTTNGFPAGTLRPNLVGNPELPPGERSLQRDFNTAAFAHPANFQFGNSPRSVLRGRSFHDVDFNFSKTFAPKEDLKTELRGEFFNVFNFANFDIPGHTLGNPDFGIVNSAKPARTVQLVVRVLF